MTQIYVFGDSVVLGFWDRKGGWVQRLRETLDQKSIDESDKFYFLVSNVGISGNTTDDLLERFEFDTKQRLKDAEGDEEVVIMFGIGGNDSAFLKSKNDFWVPPEKFKENLEKLIQLARKFSPKIIFIGLVPFDDSKTNPVSFNADLFYKTKNVKKYNEILKSVCQKNDIYFIEIFEKFENNYKDLLEDGLHPNSEGHKKIFDAVKYFLEENKIIK